MQIRYCVFMLFLALCSLTGGNHAFGAPVDDIEIDGGDAFSRMLADPVIVSISGCDTISPGNLEPGDTICLPITVENFDSITVASLGIVWDASVLHFIRVQNFGSAAIDQSTFGTAFPNGITLVAFNFPIAEGETLPDGTVLFEACFQIINVPGSTTDVVITDFQNAALEFANASEGQIPVMTTDPCVITVAQTTNLSAFLKSCGGTPGNVTISAFGGNGPYFYDYVDQNDPTTNGFDIPFPGAMSEVTFNLFPGTYDITVRDSDGNEQMYTVTVDPALMDLSGITSTPPTCYDFTNGMINLLIEDGTPPYSYIVTDLDDPNVSPESGFILMAGTPKIVPSLPPGNYMIEVTDSRGCTQTLMQALDANPFDITIVNATNATCNGTADGAITLNISGSTPFPDGTYRFDFLQNNDVPTMPDGTVSFGVLNPGEYCMTIRADAAGCDTVYCFTIGSEVEIEGDILPFDEVCAGNMDGEVSILGLTNGFPMGNYDFSIFDANDMLLTAGGPSAQFNFSPLDTGAYYVLIVDENGCMSDTMQFRIEQGAQIVVTLDSTQYDDCLPVFATGAAFFNIQGGNGGYVLSAGDGNPNGNSIEDLNAGSYTLTVTDVNMCTAEFPFEIFDYEEGLVGDELIDFQVNGTPCAGGTITVLYNGQVPMAPIGVEWVGLGSNNPTVQIQNDGLYRVNIFDGSIHCQVSSDTLIECEDIFGIDITVMQPQCNSAAVPDLFSTGSVLVDTFNAVGPVTYVWSFPADTTTTEGFLDGLAPGTYYITVTDALDSTVVDSFEIIEPAAIGQVFNQPDSTSCFNICDGRVTITPVNNDNPNDPFFLYWDRLGNPASDTGFVFTLDSLCGGFQAFTVSQDGTCFYVDSIEIPAPPPLEITPDTIIQITCYGETDGSVTISGNGGTPGYSFLWEDNSTMNSITNLGAGTYRVTLTDANACAAVDSFRITEPDSLSVRIDSSASSVLGCNSQLGMITVAVEGGTQDYTYQWNPDVTNAPVGINLQAGLYQITVTDANGCSDTTSFDITAPPPIFFTLGEIIEPPCFGDPTIVSVDTAFGGSGSGFSFSVQNGPTQPIGTAIPVTAGQYVVSVFDSTGCSRDTTIFIDQPDPLEVQVNPDQVTIDLGEIVQLGAEIIQSEKPIAAYMWAPPSGVECDTCPVTNTVILGNSQTFMLTVIDTSGCIATAEALVEISTKVNVFIPNIFTPNDDGLNETFSIFTGAGITRIPSARIFDRWGQMMYAAQDIPLNGNIGIDLWDGEFKNEKMPPGVYVYVIEVELINGQIFTYRGDVTLIR